MSLDDYLVSVARRRWKIGDLDCCTFMAGWVMACGRPDPMADVRGRYASEREYLKIIRPAGGFVAACKQRLESIGLRETAFPRAGDLLAVGGAYAARKGKVQRRPVGAIAVAADRFAVITSDVGLLIAPSVDLPLLKAWTFPNG